MISGPRRFNWVTLVLVCAVAGGGYWLWKFGLHYYDAWQVDHLLSESGAKCYRIVRIGEPDRTSKLHEYEEEMRKAILELGIEDPNLTTSLDIAKDGDEVIATANYELWIHHPRELVKPTHLRMHRLKVTDTSHTKW